MEISIGLSLILVVIAAIVIPIIWTYKIFKSKNRSGFLGVILGLFLGFIGVIIAYLMPSK